MGHPNRERFKKIKKKTIKKWTGAHFSKTTSPLKKETFCFLFTPFPNSFVFKNCKMSKKISIKNFMNPKPEQNGSH